MHAMILCSHQIQHAPSTAYTVYYMHSVLYHPKIHCHLLPASLSSRGGQCCTQLSPFPQLEVNQTIESQLRSCLPPNRPRQIDHLQVILQSRLIMASECISNLTQSWSPTSHNHGQQLHLQSQMIMPCMLAQPWPPNVSPNLLKYGLISKEIFHLGGMTPAEWTRSVRAVRATPVADHSAPGVNTTRRGVCRSPIAVSPFLRILSHSHFKRSLWRCGQL